MHYDTHYEYLYNALYMKAESKVLPESVFEVKHAY